MSAKVINQNIKRGLPTINLLRTWTMKPENLDVKKFERLRERVFQNVITSNPVNLDFAGVHGSTVLEMVKIRNRYLHSTLDILTLIENATEKEMLYRSDTETERNTPMKMELQSRIKQCEDYIAKFQEFENQKEQENLVKKTESILNKSLCAAIENHIHEDEIQNTVGSQL